MHTFGKKAEIDVRASGLIRVANIPTQPHDKALALVIKSPTKPQPLQIILDVGESLQEKVRWYEVELDGGWVAVAGLIAGTVMYTVDCLAR